MITDKEYKILEAIVKSEYQDGRPVVNNAVWIDCLNIPSDLVKSGVFGSLKKKRYVGSNEYDPKMGRTCWVTEIGYKAYLTYKPKEAKTVDSKQWNQFRNVRDDALDFPPYKVWFEEIQNPEGLMKLNLYCPLCGEVIPVTFRKPFNKLGVIDTQTFHAKARFHHCNGVSVRLELHPFDSRYHDEYLRGAMKNE